MCWLKILLKKMKSYLLSSFYRWKCIKNHQYISNLKNYSKNSADIKYSTCLPEQKINFLASEENFLKKINSCPKDVESLKIQKEIYLTECKNILFHGISGGISHNKKYIVESFHNFNRFERSNFTKINDSKVKVMKGNYCSIIHLDWGRNNHFHILIECIPRLFTLLNMTNKKMKLILHNDIERKYENLIRDLLDDRFEIVYIHKNEIWKPEIFYFPSFINQACSGFLPQEVIDFLRKTYKKSDNSKIVKGKKIYVSRKNTASRRIINEKSLIKILEENGFEIVDTTQLEMANQIELFNSASIVIAPHGAGLSNIMFSSKITVIEIFPPKSIKAHYFMLSKSLRFNYHYLIGNSMNSNEDFFVNIEEIIELLA
jgi:hypothetical protein